MQPGSKQVVKTTVRPNRAGLREEVGKYIRGRSDLASATTEPQDAYRPKRGMGATRKTAKKKQKSGTAGTPLENYGQELHDEDVEQKLRQGNASAEAAGRAYHKSLHDEDDTIIEQLQARERKEQAELGPPPSKYSIPPTGGPLDTPEKEAAYEEKYRQYAEEYGKKQQAIYDPDRPVYGMKPPYNVDAEGNRETTKDYRKRFAGVTKEYLDKHPLGSPGHGQPAAQPPEGQVQP